MANVNIIFNGKNYLLSCDEGQEESLKELATNLNTQFEKLKSELGNIGESKLLLITAIKIIDEFYDLKRKIDKTKNDFENLSNKFKEIKSLIIEYRDKKEEEILKLKEEINTYKDTVELSKISYEKLLDKTTETINDFIENAQSEKNIH